jgi:hypothetical protein
LTLAFVQREQIEVVMRLSFSLKQIFGLALMGSVVWGILLYAYWGHGWALGATLVFSVFLAMTVLAWLLTLAIDRLAFLFHGRQNG